MDEDRDRELDKRIARRFLSGMSPEDVLEVVQGLLPDIAKPEVKPWPQNGDYYWAFASSGEVQKHAWYKDGYDICRQQLGNVFRSQEEAEHAVIKQKAIVKLRNMAKDARKGSKLRPMWRSFKNADGKWRAAWSGAEQIQGVVYFPNTESCQAAIDAMGDDMNLLLED